MSVELSFLTRPGCGLCVSALETIRSTLAESIASGEVSVEIIDIETDEQLRDAYAWDIPVVLLNGRKHAKHRIDPARLRRHVETLLARAAAAGEAGDREAEAGEAAQRGSPHAQRTGVQRPAGAQSTE